MPNYCTKANIYKQRQRERKALRKGKAMTHGFVVASLYSCVHSFDRVDGRHLLQPRHTLACYAYTRRAAKRLTVVSSRCNAATGKQREPVGADRTVSHAISKSVHEQTEFDMQNDDRCW